MITKTEQLQQIKLNLMDEKGLSNDEAVNHIASLLCRSPKTIYGYLSEGYNMPDQMLELLILKTSPNI